ncbi:MAG TPA: VIT domain-containing protein [Thermoanaerobaculia bacterium]|nr:VIT domain-containing protein [Thermoanaerobaculia bacterium]
MIRRLALLALLIPIAAHAQGVLLLNDGKELPAVNTDVKLTVRGMILRGAVTQHFHNPDSSCVEAWYEFPLPDDAAVDTLRMTIGERVIEGEIQERKHAEQTYEQAKSEGKKASLLSQERPNIFAIVVSNIAGGEDVTVALEFQQSIEYRDGAFRLRLPMTVAPRYGPDAVSAVHTLVASPTHLVVDLDAGFSLRRVDSSYHQVSTTALSGSRYEVTLDTLPDRDFELTWQPDLGNEPKSALFTDNGYGLLMIMPPAASRSARLPKQSIFIIDTSGSMEGPSIAAAKSALQMALDHLDSSDSFNIIEFNSVTTPLWSDPRPATAGNLAEAKQFVANLQATGGTEMLPALDAAFRDATPEDGSVRQVVFMTDGQVSNESQLFAFIRSRLGRSRLFTVGIGTAPNTHFMRDAARFGRGTFTYIGNREEVQSKMSALFAKLESPVLTNVELKFDDPNVEMWPQRVPDLYAGEPVVVAVKFSKPVTRAEVWSGGLQATGGLKPAATQSSGIDKLWARRKIEALGDSDTDHREEIVAVALEHHLVSQYTSLVAVDQTPSGVPKEACETRPVPAMLPAGWGGIDGSLPRTASSAPLEMLIGLILMAVAAAIAARS